MSNPRNVAILCIVWILCGCEGLGPTVGYEHLSDAGVSGDGHDLLCGGGRAWNNDFEAKLAICQNLHEADRNPHFRLNLDWRPQ